MADMLAEDGSPSVSDERLNAFGASILAICELV
jgi:hypothetical protein